MSVQSTRFDGRKIILGVTGGIAAYKTAELVRALVKGGADVRIVMTPDASRFITPLTLGTLSKHEVLSEIFPGNENGSWTRHVDLGLWADLFVVAPATANTIAKLAGGICDSMLTAIALTARCPVLVCPAMDHDMYLNPATKTNLETLGTYGYHVLAPEQGELASGLIGWGRLPALDLLLDTIEATVDVEKIEQDLRGKSVVVTAGPTRESIDPVRFVSNHSTGTMGYALARAAADRGADVTLITGPTGLKTPRNTKRIDITTAAEMAEAVLARSEADLIIMAAAVADYRPIAPSLSKIKKTGEGLTIEMEPTTDILAKLGADKRDGQVLVGFAMETDDGPENARRKLVQKHADWIILNNLHEEGAGFGTGTNKVTLFSAEGAVEALPLQYKWDLAVEILKHVMKPGD